MVLDDWLDGVVLILLLMLRPLLLHAVRLLHMESLLRFLQRLTDNGRWGRSGGESGQLRLVAEEVLPELPHGRQHLVAPLALVQLLLPAEPLSLVGLEVSLELPDAAEREVAVPAAHRRRRRRGKVRPAAAAVDIIRDARCLEGLSE